MINILRKVFGILLGTALAVFTVAAVGQTDNSKKYLLTGQPGTLEKQVIAFIANQSTPQNGLNATTNIGSLVIQVDNGPAGLLIDPLQVRFDRITTGKKISITGTVTSYPDLTSTAPSAKIAITNLNPPLKGGETLKVTMSGLGCGLGSTFIADQVWSSGNLTGQEFGPLDQSFVVDVPCGSIACDNGDLVTRTDDDTIVNIDRGLYDSNGTCTTGLLPFYVTNRLKNEQRVHVKWTGPQNAAFLFDADTPALQPKLSWLNTDGSPATLDGTPAYLHLYNNDSLKCSGPNSQNNWFPRRYGVPSADIPAGSTKFKVNTTVNHKNVQEVNWPTTFPTHFIVGTERMIVTSISGGTWNLAAATTLPHFATDYVTYTPLKILTANTSTNPDFTNEVTATSSPYKLGDPVKWCVIYDPTTGLAKFPWQITGDGDPIFMGGDF